MEMSGGRNDSVAEKNKLMKRNFWNQAGGSNGPWTNEVGLSCVGEFRAPPCGKRSTQNPMASAVKTEDRILELRKHLELLTKQWKPQPEKDDPKGDWREADKQPTECRSNALFKVDDNRGSLRGHPSQLGEEQAQDENPKWDESKASERAHSDSDPPERVLTYQTSENGMSPSTAIHCANDPNGVDQVQTPMQGRMLMLYSDMMLQPVYMGPAQADDTKSDSTSADQRIEIHFDINLHKLACALVTIDLMSQSGDNQDGIVDDVFKQRLDAQGKPIKGAKPEKQAVNTKNASSPNSEKHNSQKESGEKCGSCYGAIHGCCNTCEEVREAYRIRGWVLQNPEQIEQCKNDELLKALNENPGEGCRIWGKLNVGKVGGNFHIAPGVSSTQSNSHFHDFHALSPSRFDTSHTITHLSFGKPYPGKAHPLDGQTFHTDRGGIMHQYQLKVVPTHYIRQGETLESHQFAITRLQKDIMAGASGIPGLFFQYEFSPLMVQYEERQRSLSFFLVSLCAIIGGVHTVASLLDSFLYTTHRAIQKKMTVGKFS